MIIPHYRILIEWLIRLRELLTACLLLILVAAQLIMKNQTPGGPTLHLCLLIAFVSIPCTLGLAYMMDGLRKKQIWEKLEQGGLRIEYELEIALHLLINKIRTAVSGNESESLLALADLLYLVEMHTRSCSSALCPCHKKSIV